MKTDICIKCGEELNPYVFSVKCSKCTHKEDVIALIAVAVVIGFIFISFIGLKYAWAVYAYHDWRCMFSECRIIKEKI